MNKQDVYAFLDNAGIWHEITEHAAVFTMEELTDVVLPYPDADAKNLFVRDDKKQNWYLITVKGDKRVNLKEFRKTHGTRPLSFASADELKAVLELFPGSVSPFGLLNDAECKVRFYLDADFINSPDGIVGIHPNDNTATVALKAVDLIDIVKKHGNPVDVVTLA